MTVRPRGEWVWSGWPEDWLYHSLPTLGRKGTQNCVLGFSVGLQKNNAKSLKMVNKNQVGSIKTRQTTCFKIYYKATVIETV